MTGFGKCNKQTNEYSIEIELKSTNSKYLDLKIYLSKDMSFLEPRLRLIITKYFKRGSIEVRIKYSDYTPPIVKVNESKFIPLYEIVSKLTNSLNNNTVPIEYILKEFDIIEYHSTLFESDNFVKDVEQTLKKTIKEQQRAAKKEGKSIKLQIIKTIDDISKALVDIDNTIPTYRKELYDKMKSRIESVILQATNLDIEQRLMQELAIYLDRYDIQEEISRLKEHIDTISKHLDERSENDLGKTLNFIFQEMQREANTLGSKYSNYLSFSSILLIKEEIEKCREVIQNVM
jgi:uncharacterized protein (TIGR00255 family)